MKFLNKLRPWAAFVCASTLLIPPVDARTRSGDKLLKQGQKAEAQHDYDTALTNYEQALQTDSHETAYLLAEQRAKPLASNAHIESGKKLLKEQKLNEALVQFQKALLTDPSSMIALQLIGQTNAMIKQRDTGPAGAVVLTPAEQARQDVEKRIGLLEGPPMLRPITNQISSLKMNNQTARVLYESVGKLAGINVLFDPQGIEGLGAGAGGSRNFNLDLTNVTLEEALNYVSLVTHTFWKPISRNAIFVTSESEQKRQEYQDEVVRVFYVQNASSPNEFTEIFNAVRTGAKLTTGVFQVASQNAIIARGSADTMSIVEKLVHDLDRPKAEVVVDVMVMEVSKSKVLNLGAALSGQTLGGTSVTGLAFPITPGTSTTSTGTSGTATTTTTGNSIPLSRVGKLSSNQFSVALPSALVEAFMSDSSTRLLQRPEVRVTDGGKATLKIGSKIPYVSGSLNSAVATPGSVPYATTQFQQIDVGVNIDLQPHVNGPEDVSMHIKVEVSSVTSTETIAGVQQPIIGQRVNEADLRIKDGEASLLGGLTSDQDTQSVAGLPGIANLPVLGYLFGTHTKDREKDDIIIALIPHIVRAPVVNLADEGILAGTERVVKVGRRVVDSGVAAMQAPAMNQAAPAPAGAPAAPPAQLPPLGRVLNLPPGVVPGQTTASRSTPMPPPTAAPVPAPSGAYITDGNPNKPFTPSPQMRVGVPPGQSPNRQTPSTNNSIEIYLSPNQGNTPASGSEGAQPVISNPISRKGKPPIPVINPDAPLELTSVVVTESPSRANGQNQEH